MKLEALGFVLDAWRALRGLLASQTAWAAVAALAAPRLCAVVGCDAVQAEHAIVVFLGWAFKQGLKEHAKRPS